jgi:hypothetical protein
MKILRPTRFAAALLLVVGTALAGCAGGGCRDGKCGLPNLEKSKIGVSPYCGRYIEGGHGWR